MAPSDVCVACRRRQSIPDWRGLRRPSWTTTCFAASRPTRTTPPDAAAGGDDGDATRVPRGNDGDDDDDVHWKMMMWSPVIQTHTFASHLLTMIASLFHLHFHLLVPPATRTARIPRRCSWHWRRTTTTRRRHCYCPARRRASAMRPVAKSPCLAAGTGAHETVLAPVKRCARCDRRYVRGDRRCARDDHHYARDGRRRRRRWWRHHVCAASGCAPRVTRPRTTAREAGNGWDD